MPRAASFGVVGSIAAAIVFVVACVGLMGGLGVVAAPIVLVILAEAAGRLRRRRGAIVLGYLEQAVRLNLPLPTLLRAAAVTEIGRMRDRLSALADRLEHGDPVADALRHAAPDVDARSVSLVGVGEWVGRLGPTLDYVVRRMRRADAPAASASGRVGGVYVVAVLGLVTAAAAVTMALVVPKFAAIAADFGTPLPAVTRALLDVQQSELGQSVVLLVMLAAAAAYVVACVAMTERTLVGRVRWGAAGRWLGDAVGSVVPVVGRLRRDRAMADLCFVLSESTGAQMGLNEAMREASHLRMPGVVRSRMLAWSAQMDAGRGVGEAARLAGMPRLVSGLIGPARTPADMAAAFGFVARHYEDRVVRTTELIRAAAAPLAVIAMGALVAWIVLALLTPTTLIIEATIHAAGLNG